MRSGTSLEGGAVHHEEDNGSYDGHHKARRMAWLIPAQPLSQLAAYPGPSNPQQNRDNEPTRVVPWHQQFSYDSDNEPEKDVSDHMHAGSPTDDG
jgi:hypothetical protein